jgi:hypothetical protein
MLPLILGVLGVAATGVYTVGSHAAIKDIKDEIEGINDSAERLTYETKQLIKDTNDKLDKVYEIAVNQKKYIYQTTLKKAVDVTKKMKIKHDDIELKNEIVAISNNIDSVERAILPQVANVAAIGLASAISSSVGLAGGILGTTIVGVAVTFKLDEAKEQYAKIKAECEMAKTECTKKNNVTRQIADTVNVITGLNELTKKSVDNVEEILSKKGNNEENWTAREKESVWIMSNLVKALSDIINSNIVTEKGNMSTEYENKIKKQKEVMISKGYSIPTKITIE